MNRLIFVRFGAWILDRARRLLEPFEDGFQLTDLATVIGEINRLCAELRTDDEDQRRRLVFIMVCFVVDHTEVWLDSIVDAGVKTIAAGFLGQPLDSAPGPDDWGYLESLQPSPDPIAIEDVAVESTAHEEPELDPEMNTEKEGEPIEGERTPIELPADGVARTVEIDGGEAEPAPEEPETAEATAEKEDGADA